MRGNRRSRLGTHTSLQKERRILAASLGDTLRRSRTVAFRELDGQVILVSTRSRDILILNESGLKVWEFADGTHTLEKIIDELTEIYDAERVQIETDVMALANELISIGALELAQ